jgi:hypothetical protein
MALDFADLPIEGESGLFRDSFDMLPPSRERLESDHPGSRQSICAVYSASRGMIYGRMRSVPSSWTGIRGQ